VFPSTYSIQAKIPISIFQPDYPVNPRNLGQFLKKIRIELGLQIKQAAKQAGLNDDTIIGWEVRGVKPKKEHLEKLLKFYGRKGANSKSISNLLKNAE
jgi:transcriptional regulator with XRE-family HTH domain